MAGIPYGFGVSDVDTADGQLLWLERMVATQDFDCSTVPDPVSCRLQPGFGAWGVVSVFELPKSVTTGGSGDVVVFGVPCEFDGVPDDEAATQPTRRSGWRERVPPGQSSPARES